MTCGVNKKYFVLFSLFYIILCYRLYLRIQSAAADYLKVSGISSSQIKKAHVLIAFFTVKEIYVYYYSIISFHKEIPLTGYIGLIHISAVETASWNTLRVFCNYCDKGYVHTVAAEYPWSYSNMQ